MKLIYGLDVFLSFFFLKLLENVPTRALLEGYDVSDIGISTVVLNGEIPVDLPPTDGSGKIQNDDFGYKWLKEQVVDDELFGGKHLIK